MKKEQDNRLSFLDVLIMDTEQGIRLSVYQKPKLIEQYLNFNSHHPYNVKKRIICSLWQRGISRRNEEFERHPQLQQLYGEHSIGSKKSESNDSEQYLKTHHSLSYIKVLAKNIPKSPYDIRTIFRNGMTCWKSLLSQARTEHNMTKNCLYFISYSCGKVYKDKTLKLRRLEEHQKVVC